MRNVRNDNSKTFDTYNVVRIQSHSSDMTSSTFKQAEGNGTTIPRCDNLQLIAKYVPQSSPK